MQQYLEEFHRFEIERSGKELCDQSQLSATILVKVGEVARRLREAK
jgi:hypothetical protein